MSDPRERLAAQLIRCPFCQAEWTEKNRQRGACPKCGAGLNEMLYANSLAGTAAAGPWKVRGRDHGSFGTGWYVDGAGQEDGFHVLELGPFWLREQADAVRDALNAVAARRPEDHG